MPDQKNQDESYMRLALEQAEQAAGEGDVPVGAVLVRDGLVIASGRNQREVAADPTAHAEVVVLREAGVANGGWRLSGATLYVTLEPCLMCVGAAVLARIDRIVFGSKDPKAGACGSVFDVADHPRLNHRVRIEEGVLAAECGEILTRFFRDRRRESLAATGESAPG